MSRKVSGDPPSYVTNFSPKVKMTGDCLLVDVKVHYVEIKCLVDTGT